MTAYLEFDGERLCLGLLVCVVDGGPHPGLVTGVQPRQSHVGRHTVVTGQLVHLSVPGGGGVSVLSVPGEGSEQSCPCRGGEVVSHSASVSQVKGEIKPGIAHLFSKGCSNSAPILLQCRI